MSGSVSRRSLLLAGIGAARVAAQRISKSTTFPSEWQRYADPATELEVYRLTDPSHASTLPAHYSRAISRNSGSLIYCSDRAGSLQAFLMDLKSGVSRQLTEVEELDAASLTLTPDSRGLCFFAGRALSIVSMATMRARELYHVPDGWALSPGLTVGPDGTHATFAETGQGGSRLRAVLLGQGAARTVLESSGAIRDPIPRPMRAQMLYCEGDALWLVNFDGRQKRQLRTADGAVRYANWSPDGRTILYLNLPADPTQLTSIRELTPDSNTDKLVSKTSQFAALGFNRDTSVFVGASRNKASPTVLLLLRTARREFTVCEHKATDPAAVAPRFSPDSQRIYFQSDRHGKPAIYCVHTERLVEKTDAEG